MAVTPRVVAPMKHALEAEDAGVRHVQPSFFFSKLSSLTIKGMSKHLDWAWSWACDKGWVAIRDPDILLLLDADMNRVWESPVGERWQDVLIGIDFVAEQNLILLFDNDGMAVFRYSSNSLHELCDASYEPQDDDWNRINESSGACLSLCGRYVFATGAPLQDHQDGTSSKTHIAIHAWCVESGEIVAETFVKVADDERDWNWELRIPNKHLRYASDGLPLIVSLSGDANAEDIEAHFRFQDNEFVPLVGIMMTAELARLFNLETLRERPPGPVLVFSGNIRKEIFLDKNENCERSFMQHMVVARDAQHQEAVIATNSNRFVRISLDSPKIVRGAIEVRGMPRETCNFDGLFRGSMGRMIAHHPDDDSLILFNSEGFLDFNYYRLRWRPEIHHVFPQAIRRRIETFALCIRRIGVFPKDIRQLLLRFQVIDF